MLFNSYEFIFVFLPIVFIVYFTLNGFRATKFSSLFLVIASLIFYSYWDIKYLPLILFSILVNFILGKMIISHNQIHRLPIGGGANSW